MKALSLIVPTLVAFVPLATASDSATPDVTSTSASNSTATTTSTGTLSITGTTLPQIAQEAEPCAYLCYAAACIDSGCSTGDFDCVCDNPNSLVVKLGICVGDYCDGSASIGMSLAPLQFGTPVAHPILSILLMCQTPASGLPTCAMPLMRALRAPRSLQLRPSSSRKSQPHLLQPLPTPFHPERSRLIQGWQLMHLRQHRAPRLAVAHHLCCRRLSWAL